jgi:uncharacterized protein (TIGR00369 family)
MNNEFLMRIQAWVGRTITESRSPAGNWLGFVLKEISEGEVVLEFTIRPEMVNPLGTLHGGMMSAFMDEAMGWAVHSLGLPVLYTTVNLQVDFLYGAREGHKVTARAKVMRQGKKIVNVACEVFGEDVSLLARGTSNLVATSIEIKYD